MDKHEPGERVIFPDDDCGEDDFWDFMSESGLMGNLFDMVMNNELFIRRCLGCGEYFVTSNAGMMYCLVDLCYDKCIEQIEFNREMQDFNSLMCRSVHRLELQSQRSLPTSEQKNKVTERATEATRRKVDVTSAQERAGRDGYVYLVMGENSLYKIGIARDVNKRLKGLSAQSPTPLTLKHSFCSSHYRNAERVLHTHFADNRKHYEWFQLSKEQVDWFCRLTSDDDLPPQYTYNQS